MSAQKITRQEIEAAQKAWGEGIVAIGKSFQEKGDYAAVAGEHIDTLYAYQISDVLFKPTKAAEQQFRGNFDQALSYFVATNGACAEDKGFAIAPWTKVRFENHNVVLQSEMALAMGNYYFTTLEGEDVKVEYTFGYLKDKDQKLRICLHHSSVPFSA